MLPCRLYTTYAHGLLGKLIHMKLHKCIFINGRKNNHSTLDTAAIVFFKVLQNNSSFLTGHKIVTDLQLTKFIDWGTYELYIVCDVLSNRILFSCQRPFGNKHKNIHYLKKIAQNNLRQNAQTKIICKVMWTIQKSKIQS